MTKTPRILLALWLVVGWIAGSATPCAADTAVTLHSDAELRRPVVRLSDLFIGVPKEIDRDIAQAPLPGKQAEYDAKLLSKLAEKYRLDWTPVSYTEHVTITTASTHITTDMLRDAVARKAKECGARGQIDVGFDNRALEVDLPADQSSNFTLNNFDYDPASKRFRAELSAANVTVPLSGRIITKFHVPVLVHRLEGGSIIAASDLDWIDVNEDRVNESSVTDAKQLIGRELRRTTLDGDVLHSNDVIPPRLVTRGTMVTMKIETPFMSVTTQGRALQDGALGETVRVQNMQTSRVIEGSVDSSGAVVVLTARKLAMAE